MYYQEQDNEIVKVGEDPVKVDAVPTLPTTPTPAQLPQAGAYPYFAPAPYYPPYQPAPPTSGGGISWKWILILVAGAILIFMLFFKDSNGKTLLEKLLDFAHDATDWVTGGSEGAGTTGEGDLGQNPQSQELESVPVTAKPGIQTFRGAAVVAAAQSGALRTGESMDDLHPVNISFDRKWDGHLEHNIAYFGQYGDVILRTETMQLNDFANANDESWSNMLLRVVTVGLWFIAEYSKPLDSFCYVGIPTTGDPFLSDAQMLWMGNIPQAQNQGIKYMSNQLRAGAFYNGSDTIRFANIIITAQKVVEEQDFRNNCITDVEMVKVTSSRVKRITGNKTIREIIVADTDTDYTTLSFSAGGNSVDMFGPDRVTYVQEAQTLLMEANQVLLDLLARYVDAGSPEGKEPYSIPGAICPSVDTTTWLLDDPSRTPADLWSAIAAGVVHPQNWFWEWMNWRQNGIADNKPKFCYRRIQGRDRFIVSKQDRAHKDLWAEIAALAYYIYLPCFCIGGSSVWDAAKNGYIWGNNMFMQGAGSTSEIEDAWGNGTMQSLLTYDSSNQLAQFDSLGINAAVLAAKCRPDTDPWLSKGAPAEFTRLLGTVFH